MARFKIDENLPEDTVRILADAGHDVATVREQGLGGADDDELHPVCIAEDRAIITLDRGFGDLRRHPTGGTPGTIVLRPTKQDVESILALVRRLPDLLEREALGGSLWIVEANRVRMRSG